MSLRAFLLIAAVLMPFQAFGQGHLSGTVTDPTRASVPLPAVTVTVTDLTVTGVRPQRTIVTDASGRYEVSGLCPGSYTVGFNLRGYADFLRRDVTVVSGTTVAVDASLARPTGTGSFYMPVRGFVAQNTGPIVAERIVAAPLPVVWAAWTTSDGLRSWLAPHVTIDLQVGGLMRTNYNAQGTLGDAQTIENVILSFEPERMLSIRVAKAPANTPFPNTIGEMWTVLHFESVGVDRTKIRVVGLGFTTSSESQRMRAFFERGNATTLDQLERHLSGCTP